MAFAHDKPGTCIDVNVARVIKRACFPPHHKPGRQELEDALGAVLDGHARDAANALMDFGSALCTATKPRCDACPLSAECQSKGERPEERAERAKRRQTPFLHSNRWWRGQILKAVNLGLQTETALFGAIDADDRQAFNRALAQLRKEGLLTGSRRISIRE
jgi:A/G-specific adenine glycosylase